MTAYEEQLDRVQRWLVRAEDHNTTQIEHLDFLWAFFQNCWHMKDWIKNDDELAQKVRDGIEDEVQKYNSLMACADLANRSKHLQLKNVRKDAKLRGNIKVQIEEDLRTGESSSSVSWEYFVTLDDGSQLVALDLARIAVKDWKMLLSSYGLPAT